MKRLVCRDFYYSWPGASLFHHARLNYFLNTTLFVINMVYIWVQRYLRFICLTLLSLALGLHCYATEKTLKPQNVIISSSYQASFVLPEVDHAGFDLRYPLNLKEPYLPVFAYSKERLPERFPDNVEIGWLTNLSPTLAKLIWRVNGQFQSAVLLYRQNQFQDAADSFKAISVQSPEYREIALIWNAWALFQADQPEKAREIAEVLVSSPNIPTVLESSYLLSLIHYNQKNDIQVINSLDLLATRIDKNLWNSRLIQAYAFALANMGKWQEIIDLFNHIDLKRISYIAPYGRLIKIAVISAAKTRQYSTGEAYAKLIIQTNDNPLEQVWGKMALSWFYYFSGNYAKSVKTLDSVPSYARFSIEDEMAYLKASCFVRLRKWDLIEPVVDQIPKTSPFYDYISYQIRALIGEPDKYAGLLKKLSYQNIEFPDMKFHIGILEGNRLFENQQFSQAEHFYIKAMSVDSNSDDYWIAYYNLGLTYIQQRKYQNALENFSFVQNTNPPPELADRIGYHLAISLFNTGKYEQCLKIPPTANGALSEEELYEFNLIKAGCFLGLGQHHFAREVLIKIWNESGALYPLEIAVQSYFHRGLYEEIDRLITPDLIRQSDTLLNFKIKSLLALGEFKSAEDLINLPEFKPSPYLNLKVEVLAANQKYDQIVKIVSQDLTKARDPQKRLSYYLILGDAHYNLKAYGKSKNQFYKALQLTENPNTEILILYNIILTSYYGKDYIAFLKETENVFKKSRIPDEIRFNLTVLLSDYYENRGEAEELDSLLKTYTRNFKYKTPTIHLKRVRYFYQNEDLAKCYKIAVQEPRGENTYQKTDRIVLTAYCAETVEQQTSAIKALQDELGQTATAYRLEEVTFLLAKLLENTRQYETAAKTAMKLQEMTLLPDVQMEARLILANSLTRSGQARSAIEALGDYTQYRNTVHYIKALKISAEISARQKDINRAVRAYLRLYYLPETPEIEKEKALLWITELLIHEDTMENARRFFDKIDPAVIKQDSAALKTYERLKQSIQSEKIAEIG